MEKALQTPEFSTLFWHTSSTEPGNAADRISQILRPIHAYSMTEPQSFKADICNTVAPQDTFLFETPKNVAFMMDSPPAIFSHFPPASLTPSM